MPKSARITGMSVLGVTEEGTVDLSSTQAEATVYYGCLLYTSLTEGTTSSWYNWRMNMVLMAMIRYI